MAEQARTSWPPVVVSADALAAAQRAIDEPPLLVVLNARSCATEERQLVGGKASFAIGHAGSIVDSDVTAYATRYYASLADPRTLTHVRREPPAEGSAGAVLPKVST